MFNIDDYLNTLPLDTKVINISKKKLETLPEYIFTRFIYLEELDCSSNKLISLPELNINLLKLNCSFNKLTRLPNLNDKLIELKCTNNKLSRLPELNNNLKKLKCDFNNLTYLLELSDNLEELYCTFNDLYLLPDPTCSGVKIKIVYIFLQFSFNRLRPLLSIILKSLLNINKPFSNLLVIIYLNNIKVYFLHP